MRITNVEFARKKNLGNFETQDIKLSADVDEGEDVRMVIDRLKEIVKEKNI